MKKFLYSLFALIALPCIIYLVGPRVDYPEMNFNIANLDYQIHELDDFLTDKEKGIVNLKDDNESRIIWADSTKTKSEYAIVYLHGFSASPMEGKPVHLNFAKKYGMNMYLPRLAQHGIKDREIFKTLTPKLLMDEAKEAVAIGNLIGHKVILMSCSTGSTLSIPLAAENPELVDALIMFSPNFALFDSKAKLLTGPWGLQLARKIQGSDYRQLNMPLPAHQYWTMEYRLEGVIALQSLIDHTMQEQYFKKIEDPIFAGYYYENEEKQDKIISIDAVNKFLALVATPKDQMQIEAFPDTKAHVIISPFKSKDLESPQIKLDEFARNVLSLSPVE